MSYSNNHIFHLQNCFVYGESRFTVAAAAVSVALFLQIVFFFMTQPRDIIAAVSVSRPLPPARNALHYYELVEVDELIIIKKVDNQSIS